jgi:hypothetical protein
MICLNSNKYQLAGYKLDLNTNNMVWFLLDRIIRSNKPSSTILVSEAKYYDSASGVYFHLTPDGKKLPIHLSQ